MENGRNMGIPPKVCQPMPEMQTQPLHEGTLVDLVQGVEVRPLPFKRNALTMKAGPRSW